MIRDAFAFDAAAIAQIQVDAWRASYADIISQQTLSRLSVQSITRQWEQWFFTPGREQICLVHVSNTGKVLGYAMGGASRTHQSNAHLARAAGRAEIQVLYVAPDIKGQGAGRALMQAMARRFDRQGWRSMVTGSQSVGAVLSPYGRHAEGCTCNPGKWSDPARNSFRLAYAEALVASNRTDLALSTCPQPQALRNPAWPLLWCCCWP